eukprot:gnl/TRDRNA2_/TRDRNA2_148594_c1_seq1.p1 gnl/TRDRNA2_/TRDRNA2_148594_c1~~gnl/TRDRNA2_/TRDRNA2_148594_c1_seq1.p1  ORF type:complete len:157 (+),score=13.00 gnl/TRDRNA2_/TRDRNA2_148594_c1_seq1:1-471(+)
MFRDIVSSSVATLVSMLVMCVCGAYAFTSISMGSAVRMLSGDAMLYPGLITLSGFTDGYLFKLATPGTWYSTDNMVLAISSMDQLGRFISLPLTRLALESADRNVVAIIHGINALVIVVLAYIFVWRTSDFDSKKSLLISRRIIGTDQRVLLDSGM